MADIKISQLGADIEINDSDILPVVSGGQTLKATAAQLKEHAIGDTDISDLGDGTPTGAIAALKQALTTSNSNIAYINTNSTTASKPYTKGEQFILDGVLRTALTNIANGATLTLNSNYKNSARVCDLENVSSYFTAQNGAVIQSAYKSGRMVQVSIEIPANCASETVLASVDSIMHKQGGSNANVFAITQRFGVVHGIALLADTDMIIYEGDASYNAKQYAQLIYMSN